MQCRRWKPHGLKSTAFMVFSHTMGKHRAQALQSQLGHRDALGELKEAHLSQPLASKEVQNRISSLWAEEQISILLTWGKAEGGEANIALAAKTPVVPIFQLLKNRQIFQLIENIYFWGDRMVPGFHCMTDPQTFNLSYTVLSNISLLFKLFIQLMIWSSGSEIGSNCFISGIFKAS